MNAERQRFLNNFPPELEISWLKDFIEDEQDKIIMKGIIDNQNHWNGWINGFYYEGFTIDNDLYMSVIKTKMDLMKFRQKCTNLINQRINKS